MLRRHIFLLVVGPRNRRFYDIYSWLDQIIASRLNYWILYLSDQNVILSGGHQYFILTLQIQVF